jgi:phosphatidylserine decarboxylase
MNNFFDILKLVTFPIHKEGYKFIMIFAAATIVLALLSNFLGLIGAILTLWCIFFFRDPERITPVEENVVVSPADGVVTAVEYGVSLPPEFDDKNKSWTKISVFLNVFNVHVNRVPVGGEVKKIIYSEGKFLSANLEEASEENERNAVLLQTKSGQEIVFVQVAGLVARRIISDLKEGQSVSTGEKYGIIRFGSRADIYFPESVSINALVGQTMTGGETIIAKMN